MQNELNYLDRNEFNFEPSKEVVEAFRNFDVNKFAFYTRIYDEGKKKHILCVFIRVIRYRRTPSDGGIWRRRSAKENSSLFSYKGK